MTRLADPRTNLRVAVERDRGCKERGLEFVLVEEAHESPDAGTAPVLVNRLGREISKLGGHHVVDLRKPFVAAVARRHRVLGSFLVVDDDVDGYAGFVWPNYARSVAAIADVVAWRPRNVLVFESHRLSSLTLSSEVNACSKSRPTTIIRERVNWKRWSVSRVAASAIGSTG